MTGLSPAREGHVYCKGETAMRRNFVNNSMMMMSMYMCSMCMCFAAPAPTSSPNTAAR